MGKAAASVDLHPALCKAPRSPANRNLYPSSNTYLSMVAFLYWLKPGRYRGRNAEGKQRNSDMAATEGVNDKMCKETTGVLRLVSSL